MSGERSSRDFFSNSEGPFTNSVIEEEPEIRRTRSFEIVRQYQETKERISLSKRRQSKDGDQEKKIKKLQDMDEHFIPIEDLVARLDTDLANGLTSEKAAAVLSRDGPNRLSPPRQTPQIVRFLSHMFGGFSLLLWFGAFLSIIAYFLNSDPSNIYLAIILILVVVVTAVFEYFQDSKAAKVMEKFKNMVPQSANVIRDGKEMKINSKEVVIGDLVLLDQSMKVAADVRITESFNIKVDNSSLTGESDPQSRTPEGSDENPLETKNLAFYSTKLVEGSGKGIVINTGDRTVIGQIAGLASSTTNMETPIRREITHVIHIITVLAIGMGTIFFLIGLLYYSIITNIIFAIGIITANVPEGLLATVTVALTLTAKRMAEKKVLVKNLESVETLGSTTTICSDKTGTLTQNKMTLVHLWIDGQIHTTNSLTTTASYSEDSAAFQAILQGCGLCTNARFTNDEEEDADMPTIMREVSGDGSESAMIKFCQDIKPIKPFRAANPRITQIPFNSTNKFHIAVNHIERSDHFLVMMKGAPERVIDRCSKILVNGEEIPLDDVWLERFQNAYDELGGKGERVLGHARQFLDYPVDYNWDPDAPNFPLDGFTFTGLVALIDPPRAAVPTAVLTCQEAGIRVVMVTGDHPITARAIARQVNIISENDVVVDDFAKKNGISVQEVIERGPIDTGTTAIVVTGSELLDMSDETLSKVMEFNHIVFARTSPEQKLQIVSGFQKRGEIVAVTGDGVNDSPALKKADIGVAMGITGAEVSHEAADMILLDDNFASIVKGVEEGRLIFDNLKKSIAYVLTHLVPEIGPFLVFLLLRLPLPLSTIMMLCIDLGTDMLPAISMAYEPPESDIMKRKPRNAQRDHLVNAKLLSFAYLQMGIIEFFAVMYAYFVTMGDFGFRPVLLLNKADYFDSTSNKNGTEIYDGRNFTQAQRLNALGNAQTAVFAGVVVTQICNLLVCKTRWYSLFQQGLRNRFLNFGLLLEVVIVLFVAYCPGMDTILNSRPLSPRHFLPPIPFGLLIFIIDEARKLTMRNYPNGWIKRMTYY